jgi:hypothetical protein
MIKSQRKNSKSQYPKSKRTLAAEPPLTVLDIGHWILGFGAQRLWDLAFGAQRLWDLERSDP